MAVHSKQHGAVGALASRVSIEPQRAAEGAQFQTEPKAASLGVKMGARLIRCAQAKTTLNAVERFVYQEAQAAKRVQG